MKNGTRTDPHRPGALIPEDYEFVVAYQYPSPADLWVRYNIDVVAELRRSSVKFADIHGGTQDCDICGTFHFAGAIFRHVPTGEHIHVGWICASKMELHAGEEEGIARRAALAQRGRAQRQAEIDAIYAQHEGLKEALALDHPILADLGYKLRRWRSLSEKQIALALKIAHELANPKEAEKHVPVPAEGRQAIKGRIMSIKTHEGSYGETLKMTVKVETPEGSWLVWGTVPDGLDARRGDEVEFTAQIKHGGRDPHFGFFKRPTKARITEKVQEGRWAQDPERCVCQGATRIALEDASFLDPFQMEAAQALGYVPCPFHYAPAAAEKEE